MSYHVRRVDANQPEIVKRFRSLGVGVLILSEVGRGCPDLLVAFPNKYQTSCLIEIKDGKKPPSAQKLTPDEQAFHNTWPGELVIIKSLDEVDLLFAKMMEV